MSVTTSLRHFSLLSLGALLPACGSGGGGGGPASISGTIDFQGAGTTVPLHGGSGTVDAATPEGLVRAGSRRSYLVTDGELLHALDFVAREPLHVRATARGAGELALAAYDPVELRFGAFAPPAQGELALEFDARGSFDVVLRGQGKLTLEFTRAAAAPARGVRSAAADLDGARALFANYEEPVLESMPGELIVAPLPGTAVGELLAAHGLVQKLRMPDGPVLAGFDAYGQGTRAARLAVLQHARALAEDAAVEYAEANGICRALGVVPNDPHYHLQWDMPLLRMSEAWGLSTGSASVIVAVIDTGETPHPDLVARQVPGYDFISSAANSGDGDGIDPDPFDEGDGDGLQPNSFHGTHVSGTIGASTDNGTGVAGVTWATGIMSLRALGAAGGTMFDLANAVKYAAGLANSSGALPAQAANVINMSLGSPGTSSTLQTACAQAKSAGVVLFAAAGNENSSAPSYPAAYSSVISVAAVDLNAQRAPYSNFGPTVDLAAPGGDTSHDLDNDGYVDGILSTLMDGQTPPYTPIYAFYQGTSMACPHAAGVAALMLAVAPTLTPAEIETLLKDTAVDLGAPGRDDLYGEGLVDAYEAVYAAQNGAGSGVPVLGLSPLLLSFGASSTALSSQVTNLGSGLLDVGTLTIFMSGGGSWLGAVAVPSASGSSDTASIAVSVDRTGLADGDYSGSVSVASNGGTKVITVAMSVDSTAPPDVDLYVLLVTADTLETVAQAIVNPTTVLDYSMPDLPAGDYYLVCGSDDDNDGFILGAGDVYAGLYPTINEPVAIALGAHETLDAVDFPVVDFAAFAAPTWRGYRVLGR
jgi:serine protease